MSVSIIIPVYNDAKGLESTITTLFKNNPEPTGFDVIVIIDGGLEQDINKIEELIKLHPNHKITYHCIKPNKGSYNARNIGAKNSTANILAFLDAGVYVQKGWYTALQEHIQKNDYIAGSIEIPWNWADDLFEKYESITSFPVREYLSKKHFGPTANMVVKRSVFIKVGGFDNRLFSGGDLDFGIKVFSMKYTQFFAENMRVLHEPRNRLQLKEKINRVTKGHSDLQKLYPGRFQKKNPFISFLKSMIKIFFFPSKFKTKRSEKFSWPDFIIVESCIAYYQLISRVKYY